jgi:hypothetical protein
MSRLFTVEVAAHVVQNVGRDFAPQQVWECDFAGIHFSRENEADLIKWVRVAARNTFGKDTQVIFLHTERDTP